MTVRTSRRALYLSNLRCRCVLVLAPARLLVVPLRHRHPPVQDARAEQIVERAAELAAHRAVEDEVYRRVDQRQHVHHVT